MDVEKAIKQISYYQWSLQTGGIVPQYAKSQIREILNEFNEKDINYIKEKVTEKFS